MPSGLAALLDDVAGIAKLAAASVDDVGVAAGRAGTKTAGVVIDDAAVTPKYVTGLTPDRELPIIARIARGSLFNKLVILLPAALLLSAFLPWAVTPLLMIGGAYLCFEGAEKIVDKLLHADHKMADAIETLASRELEDKKVKGAVRTDLILSAEIMAISLGEVTREPLLTQGIALVAVSVAVTVGVYGVVALLVKLDDIGLALAEREQSGLAAFGRGLLHAMPTVMQAISVIGTAAMLWVGGGIIVHGMEQLGAGALPHLVHEGGHMAGEVGGAVVEWIATAAFYGLVGLLLGTAIVGLHAVWGKLRGGH